MNMRRMAGCIASALACLFVTPGSGAAERLDVRAAFAKSEGAIGRVLGKHALTDSSGTQFSLGDYRGKPLVISLVYTSCSSVCPATTQRLIDAVNEGGRDVGLDRFNVLTIGFDARNDTPARLAQFSVTQGVALANWRFASADVATLTSLLGELGFSYQSVAGGFDHVTQTTIIDRDGKVSRHIYGEDFPLVLFVEPLREVVHGKISERLAPSSIVDRIRLICTVYDPGAGRYRIDYGLVFGSVLAAISLALIGGLILREWLRTRRARVRSTQMERSF